MFFVFLKSDLRKEISFKVYRHPLRSVMAADCQAYVSAIDNAVWNSMTISDCSVTWAITKCDGLYWLYISTTLTDIVKTYFVLSVELTLYYMYTKVSESNAD